MTLAEVLACVDRIRILADVDHDDEQAHEQEDVLRHDVLRAIASRQCVHPVEMAALALTTSDIKFRRWCA